MAAQVSLVAAQPQTNCIFKISEVQDCLSQGKGALYDHQALSQVASVVQSETGISWMLYIVKVASF